MGAPETRATRQWSVARDRSKKIGPYGGAIRGGRAVSSLRIRNRALASAVAQILAFFAEGTKSGGTLAARASRY